MKIKFLFPLLAAFGLMACGGADEPAPPADEAAPADPVEETTDDDTTDEETTEEEA